MRQKLIIAVDAVAYDGLHSVIGRRRISRFLNHPARPPVTGQDLSAGYAAMAADAAREQRGGASGRTRTQAPKRLTMSEPAPQRGEVWLVSFGPAIGGEIQKTRPAPRAAVVVLRSNTANALLNRVQLVLVSSLVGRLYPAEAYIRLDGERRKAMADQITTASKHRLLCSLGGVSRDEVDSVAKAVGLQPGL